LRRVCRETTIVNERVGEEKPPLEGTDSFGSLPDSPWDDASRRPSHADRRKALQREMLQREFQQCWGRWPLPEKIRHLLDRVLRLVA
jgi:hypothetical protein